MHTRRLFVRPGLGQLMLGASRWVLAGAHLPADAVAMAASGEQGRRQVGKVLRYVQKGKKKQNLCGVKGGHQSCLGTGCAASPHQYEYGRTFLDWLALVSAGLAWVPAAYFSALSVIIGD
jgi:hypothetical protein